MVGLAASSVGVVIGCLMGMSCLFFMDVGKNERRGDLCTPVHRPPTYALEHASRVRVRCGAPLPRSAF